VEGGRPLTPTGPEPERGFAEVEGGGNEMQEKQVLERPSSGSKPGNRKTGESLSRPGAIMKVLTTS